MRLTALLTGTGYIGPMPEDVEIKGISYDTRTLRPGELFVALRGYKTDGHLHLEEARAKGAAALLAEEGEGTLPVPDSRAALAALSANWFGHPGRALTLIGVTGTNGKTTVTTLLHRLLTETLHTKVGLLGTNEIRVGEDRYPAHRTTPESYETQQWLRTMVDAGCTHCVMEVSSHALCLHRVAGLTFRVGAFTNLTRDHLDFHGTMEAYRRAKGKLFSQSEVALLNIDDPAGEYYVKEISCPVMTYAAARPADLTARGAEFSSNGVRFQAGLGEEIARVHVAIPGAFTVSNALCALGCARCLGIPLREGAKALHHAAGPRGRMEVVSWPGPGTVVIDYAHTPDALENALAALRPFTPGRLICLFGCGGDRDRTKRPIMGAIAARLADICVVTSDNPRSEPPEDIISEILAGMPAAPLPVVEPDRPHAIRAALAMLKEGDTLLLAGKGHETYQEVNGVQYPMDEREIIAAARP